MRMLLAALFLAASAGAAGAVSFSQADRNHDGVVTWEEAKRVFPRLTEIQFRKNDPNGDGVIAQQEFPLLANFYWMIWKMPG
ncbi:MAG TPA: EF-hand domain-containing protein [Amaricoccus sp.]|nr:EF-hand domain-containing protein [Amaricoccus sp.]